MRQTELGCSTSNCGAERADRFEPSACESARATTYWWALAGSRWEARAGELADRRLPAAADSATDEPHGDRLVKIAVLGTGIVGTTLGGRWAERGHEVHFGSRNPATSPARAKVESMGEHVRLGTWQEAVVGADSVRLAFPWKATESILPGLEEYLDGKTLIDCINPVNATFSGLDLDHATSAGEAIANLVPRARVVKAFNSVSAATMANPIYDGEPATLFYCGDDAAGKQTVDQLAAELGFQAVDTGSLRMARYLEPLAMLYIQLAMTGWGSNCAFRIVKR
jgi:8-hydroxy-5-deazaflavin:NADPH oxidoreductase